MFNLFGLRTTLLAFLVLSVGCVDDASNSGRTADGGMVAQCADGLDNDDDGLIDSQDPQCTGADDNDESSGLVLAQCADMIDNDGDGDIDLDDRGCTDAADDSESGEVMLTQCSDEVDNDE